MSEIFVYKPKKVSTSVGLNVTVEGRIGQNNVALSILRITIGIRTSVSDVL